MTILYDDEQWHVRVCSCGRIHFIKHDDLINAFNSNQRYLLVCMNCGNNIAIEADKELAMNDSTSDKSIAKLLLTRPKMIYHLKEFNFKDKYESAILDKSSIASIHLSRGLAVPMINRHNANWYNASKFKYVPDIIDAVSNTVLTDDFVHRYANTHLDWLIVLSKIESLDLQFDWEHSPLNKYIEMAKKEEKKN